MVSEKGYGKKTPFEDYRETKRGAKGVYTIKSDAKIGKLVAMNAVNGEEDLLIVTKAGIVIRINLARVSEQSRQTMGVRLIRLDEKDVVSSIAVVEPSTDPEEEITEVPSQEE